MTRRCRWKVCYEATRADGRVWAVQAGRQPWVLTPHVSILAPSETVYRGPTAKQPRAYLTGNGRVFVYALSVVIRP